MCKIKMFLPVLFLFFGCASNVSTVHPDDQVKLDRERVDKALLESAIAVRNSIRVMEETRNALALSALTPEQRAYAQAQQAQVPKGMGRLMTINDGANLHEIVEYAASLAGYRFEEYGVRKMIPVKALANARPIVDVLRDVGVQANSRAWVCVFPSPTDNEVINGVVAINYAGGCNQL